MEKRVLGKSDLEVSAVGFGCMGLTHAYGAPSDVQEATDVLVQAVDMGYTFFDTAECYIGTNPDGTTAYNEELVGNALRPYRNHLVIATKCGVRHEDGMLVMDSRPETIRRSLEGSLCPEPGAAGIDPTAGGREKSNSGTDLPGVDDL